MTGECFSAEDLEDLARAPESDPRWSHLERCARCRVLWIEYREFMTAPPDDDADLRRAEDALARFLDTQVVRATPPSTGEAPEGSILRRMVARLVRPAARPAWVGAAALLVMAVAIGVLRPHSDSGPTGVLRGTTSGEISRVVEPALHSATIRPDGSLEFTWGRVPGARSYEIRLFASDLTLLIALDAGSDTTLRVEPTRLPSGLDPGTLLLWRVAARSGDAAPSLSPVGVVRLP